MGFQVLGNLQVIRHLFLVLSLLLAGTTMEVADVRSSTKNGWQDLLQREVLFLHHQQEDALSAIAHLKLAQRKGLLSDDPARAELLLTELLLAYGSHEAARSLLLEFQDGEVPESVRNRGWYGLAKVLFYKGYPEAAKTALERITANVPRDLQGDHQLLSAHVLMALDLNQAAADALERWEGPADQAGYAHYNRGIALMRAGHDDQAIAVLGKVVDVQADSEALRALKDKAHLALGNLSLELDDPVQAQRYFEGVRLQGPFSNRALLGAGWAALARDEQQAALTPWMELRRRALIDPAVQESLFTVPAVQRALQALTTAARSYEQAIAAFTGELQRLDAAIASVQQDGVIRAGQSDRTGLKQVSLPGGQPVAVAPESRYLGQLLAGHNFQEALTGYHDLRSLEARLAEWLRRLDALEDFQPPTLQADAQPTMGDPFPQPAARPGNHEPAPPSQRVDGDQSPALPSRPAWVAEWEQGAGPGARPPQRPAGPLPQVELPPERAIDLLPQSQFSRPVDSEVIWLPSRPEVRWLPSRPGVKWLPQSSIAWLPEGGSVRLPQPNDQQFPHPEFTARAADALPASSQPRRVLRRVAPPDVAQAAPAAPSRDGAPQQRPGALEGAQRPIDRLGRAVETTPPGSADFAERIAALRARILALRPRVASALEAHMDYVNALALEELRHRQRRLRALLEQAQLELAKTYDLAGSN